MTGQRIAVIGGVAAGPAAAAHAARTDPSAEVFLFEQGQHISYGACEIPYYVADQIESASTLIVYEPNRFEEEKGAAVRTGHEVKSIHPGRRRLVVEERMTGRTSELRFDKFILATGAVPRRIELEGADADNVFYVRSLEEAVDLKNYLSRQIRHAVVLGGGYIGVEMAEALMARDIRTTILEPGPGILHGYASAPLREIVEGRLSARGVQIRREGAVRLDIDPQGRVTSVGTDRGEKIGCQLVIVAIGSEPNVCLARDAGLRLTDTGAVEVSDNMRTSAPNVWACGDCVEVKRVVDGRRIYLPLSPTAFRTAHVAAENAARKGRGRPAVFPGVVGASAVKAFGLEVARAGLSLEEAIASGFDAFAESVEGWSRVSFYPGARRLSLELIVDRKRGRLLGGSAVGEEGAAQRVNVLVPLIWKGWTVGAIRDLDLIYTPPLAPAIDPLIVAANRAARRI